MPIQPGDRLLIVDVQKGLLPWRRPWCSFPKELMVVEKADALLEPAGRVDF
jgi:hypothetical protein